MTAPRAVTAVATAPETPPQIWHALALTFAIWLLLHGVGLNEYAMFGKITADLTHISVEPSMQFLYSSPFMFALGAMLRPIGQSLSFVVTYGCGLVLMCLMFWRWLQRAHPAQPAALLLFMLWSPLLIVTLHWAGKGDPWLLAFYMLHRSSKHKALQSLWCLLMVLCHREMGSLLVVIECICTRQIRWAALPGLALGHALIWLYHHRVLDAMPVGRIGFLGADWLSIPQHNAANVFGFLALSLGCYWVYLAAFARPNWREVATLLICFAAALFTLDYTRVFTILALPVILLTLPRGLPKALQWLQKRYALPMACGLCLLSMQMVNSELSFSKLPENIDQIHKVVGHRISP